MPGQAAANAGPDLHGNTLGVSHAQEQNPSEGPSRFTRESPKGTPRDARPSARLFSDAEIDEIKALSQDASAPDPAPTRFRRLDFAR